MGRYLVLAVLALVTFLLLAPSPSLAIEKPGLHFAAGIGTPLGDLGVPKAIRADRLKPYLFGTLTLGAQRGLALTLRGEQFIKRDLVADKRTPLMGRAELGFRF